MRFPSLTNLAAASVVFMAMLIFLDSMPAFIAIFAAIPCGILTSVVLLHQKL